MFYNTCDNPANFDFQVVIDTDQVDLYKPLLDRYPQISRIYVEHQEASWLNIINAQFKYVAEHDYYFIWAAADDIDRLQPHWDTEIVSKKKTFADDLFSLYNISIAYGRNQEDYISCYTGKSGLTFLCDAPIQTKKWYEFLSILFKEPTKYVFGREAMTAALIMILYTKYNENRHVATKLNYLNIEASHTYHKMMHCWEDLVKRNYDDLYVLAEKMKEYIDSCKDKT
jgi:hypothetical protein